MNMHSRAPQGCPIVLGQIKSVLSSNPRLPRASSIDNGHHYTANTPPQFAGFSHNCNVGAAQIVKGTFH